VHPEPVSSGDSNRRVLAVTGVHKNFPGVHALTDVSLALHPGEVLGLVGENGAGKSTLIKILSGLYRPDAGRIELDGQEARFSSPQDALGKGIATVFQEGMVVPNLSVADNVLLGREPSVGPYGMFLDEGRVRLAAEEALRDVGFSLSVDRLAGSLSVAERQLAEIARAVSLAASVIVLDEPTAALTPDEVDRLLEAMRRLRSRGLAILYVTHRLEEVPRICDRVVVLRDGRVAGELRRESIEHNAMVRLMLGRDVQALFPPKEAVPSAAHTILEVHDLLVGAASPVSFSIRGGEILALAGLLGGGQKAVARAIYGASRPLGGEVSVSGRRLEPGSPAQAIAVGLGFVSGDRHRDGLLPQLPLKHNITISALRRLSRLGFIQARAETNIAERFRTTFHIRSSGIAQLMATLSGGNQQKALLARQAATEPSVLILDDPTLGVDIGARHEVYALIHDLTIRGVAILLVSSDIPEVVGLSHRVLVFADGRVTAELREGLITDEAILRSATAARREPTGGLLYAE
jgi:ABC-type sugar transport system ATPase subunit